MCIRDSRQRQLLSFDAGSTGTGDSKAKGGKDSESCSCSRASPYRVWKGKTEIQGVSVSEGTANPVSYTHLDVYKRQDDI